MKITITIKVDDKEVTRNYQVDDIYALDYLHEVNDILDTLEDNK